MTELIQEDLTTRGPGKTTNVVDEHTNEPIAVLSASGYGRGVSARLHPTFLAIHPEAKDSLDIRDIVNSYDNKSAALSQISYIHNKFLANGSQDHFKHTTVGDGNDLDVTTYHDRKTGEPVIKHTGAVRGYYGSTELHPDFIAKHSIPESVVKAKNSDLTKARQSANNHMGFSELAKNMVHELSKKKYATATHQTRPTTIHYTIHSTPEEASAAHEGALTARNPHLKLTRLSPTSFYGESPTHIVHSVIVGDTLMHTSHIKGSEEKSSSDSF